MAGSPYFQFKRFTIRQDRCAMKVTLDACLFGAWLKLTAGSDILDVGTGTGLLALMAAQRYPARIDALEIDPDATRQADKNVADSPWAERIRVINASLQHFSTAPENQNHYRHVVCNPPFYHQDSKPKSDKKRIAWHQDQLDFPVLAEAASCLLQENGCLHVLGSFPEKDRLLSICLKSDLFPAEICHLRSFPSRPPHRVFVTFSRYQSNPVPSDLVIYDVYPVYSPDVGALLSEYFIRL